MTITRNNETIELTEQELEQAYREQKHNYTRQDIIARLKSNFDDDTTDWDRVVIDEDASYEIGYYLDVPGKQLKELLTDNMIDEMTAVFENYLDRDDYYWDQYWENAESAINYMLKEALKEKK